MTTSLFLKIGLDYLIGINHIGAAFRHPGGQLSVYLVNRLEAVYLVGNQAEAMWTWLNATINARRFVCAGHWMIGRQHVTAALQEGDLISFWVTSLREAITLPSDTGLAAWNDLSSMLHSTALSIPSQI